MSFQDGQAGLDQIQDTIKEKVAHWLDKNHDFSGQPPPKKYEAWGDMASLPITKLPGRLVDATTARKQEEAQYKKLTNMKPQPLSRLTNSIESVEKWQQNVDPLLNIFEKQLLSGSSGLFGPCLLQYVRFPEFLHVEIFKHNICFECHSVNFLQLT